MASSRFRPRGIWFRPDVPVDAAPVSLPGRDRIRGGDESSTVGRGVGRTVALLVLCLGLSIASFSRGAAAADTEDLLRRGIELRRSGKDPEALVVFQQAYEQSKAPKAMVQIGFAEQALGKWGAADRHLRAAVQSSDDAWIGKHRKAISTSTMSTNGMMLIDASTPSSSGISRSFAMAAGA
jgi:hypothetical protein